MRIRRGIAAASGEKLPAAMPKEKTVRRQDDSEVEMLRHVYKAARSLLQYNGDDVAQILSAVNALRSAVEKVSREGESSGLNDDGPPWVK